MWRKPRIIEIAVGLEINAYACAVMRQPETVRIVVLGAAAGGGYPQWNCGCANCRRAWAEADAARPRTQSSLAVSADGRRWLLLNASPDLRQQILATPALHPAGLRQSPIAGAVLTNADVDHIAGLLSLRERQPLVLYATQRVLDVLNANPIFDVLDRGLVARRALAFDAPTPLSGPDGALLGLSVTAFAVPGKAPLYLEMERTQEGDTIGLELAQGERRFFYLPSCAALPPPLAERLKGAALLFFDGTLSRDDEMIAAGIGAKTGARMGHMSMSGERGALAALAPLGIARKIFIHINNTNPVLLADSPERAAVERAGWEVAEDGMEIAL